VLKYLSTGFSAMFSNTVTVRSVKGQIMYLLYRLRSIRLKLFSYKSFFRQVFLSFFFICASGQILAWDGNVAGKIAGIDVANAGNYAFRVTLVNSPLVCLNGSSWGYLDDTDPTYKVYIAVLLSAQARNATVTLFSNRDANGYCKIQYISASS
jgi:hypothetical protein